MWAICRITLPQLGHNCQDTSDTKIVENHHRMAGVLTSYSQCLDLHILFNRVCKIAKSDCYFVMSVRLLGTTRVPTDGFSNIDLSIFRKSAKKIQVSLTCDRNNG